MAASSRHQAESRVSSDLAAASYLSFRKGRRRKPSSSSTTTQAKPSCRPLCKRPRSDGEGSPRPIRLKLTTEKSNRSNFFFFVVVFCTPAHCDCAGSELALCFASSGSTSLTCWREGERSFWCLPITSWSWITSPPSWGKRLVRSTMVWEMLLRHLFQDLEEKNKHFCLLLFKETNTIELSVWQQAANRGLNLQFCGDRMHCVDRMNSFQYVIPHQ